MAGAVAAVGVAAAGPVAAGAAAVGVAGGAAGDSGRPACLLPASAVVLA